MPLLIAFGAGVLSFLSPCVLPLIPSYLCFLGGTATVTGQGRFRVAARTLWFILGFSTVFVLLSLLVSATFVLLGGVSRSVNAAAGLVVILLGLTVTFDFIGFLGREKRLLPTLPATGPISAFLTGAAFGAGWTPCVGPILGSILLMAGQTGRLGMAALSLAAYSAGLGLPFFAAALVMDRFTAYTAGLRQHLVLIRRVSGVLLVMLGLLMFFGQFALLNRLILQWQGQFIDWAEGRGPAARALGQWLLFLQGF
jgi:cytochrome c-type biogenesis protein